MEIFTVYILYSDGFDKYYIGQTFNVDLRIELHNAGSVRSTKPYKPWRIVCCIEKHTRSDSIDAGKEAEEPESPET